MTQKEIITLIAKWFNISEILELEDFGGSTENASQATQAEIDEIIYCINLVVDELACDYFPLLHTQKISSTDGKIYYSQLEKTILKIFSLKDSNQSIPYKLFPDHIKVDYDSNFTLTYSFIPSAPQTITGALEIIGAQITPRLLAYGVAREYCIFKSLYEQADYYNSRFVSAINVASTKRAIKWPKRRWL